MVQEFERGMPYVVGGDAVECGTGLIEGAGGRAGDGHGAGGSALE